MPGHPNLRQGLKPLAIRVRPRGARREEHHRKLGLGYEGELERLQTKHALSLGLEERPPSGGHSE